jgi:hypothetical protein
MNSVPLPFACCHSAAQVDDVADSGVGESVDDGGEVVGPGCQDEDVRAVAVRFGDVGDDLLQAVAVIDRSLVGLRHYE